MASNFKITFLGTGGSWPSPGRALPSVAVQIDDTLNLLDCGEGTQKQLMKSSLSFMKVKNVFLTHFHGDHFLGLMGMIQSMSFNGREEELHIYGPVKTRDIVSAALNVGYYTLSFPVYVHELKPGEEVDLGHFRVRTLKCDHPVPAMAYSLEEPDAVRIDRAKVDSIGIPKRLIEKVRDQGFATHNGRTYSLDEISGGIRKGRKIVYSGDTRPMKEMVSFSAGANVLIHETTTDSSLEPKVNEFGHCSSRQAAEIARDAGVKRFYLYHYSPRITDVKVLENEARSIFTESYASRELLEYDIPVPRE
ncbi:MAG: ribonuclease Z [Candidatus Thermoplasmatota archaeon]|jgi:ribonuclease Z|nr:ribonuclease Z [Candidatus Thermoplasmatota archaeon]